jgi:hypothetical protein
MAKSNALTWIVREAKKLRREYPNRFDSWKEYVAQASAIYASKNRGRSPIGRKHPHKKKSTMAKRKRHVAGPRKRKVSRTTRRRSRRVGESGISTNSRRHTDYNRNKVNITVGSINKDKRRARDKIEQLIGREEVKKFKTRKVRAKKKIQKKISALKSDYRRLSI